MGLILLRNPLIYPGGYPGFDLRHLAARNVRYSGVAINAGTLLNMLNGQSATINGTVTGGVKGSLGQAVTITTSTSYLSVPGVNETPSAITIAAILRLNAASGTQFIFNNNGNTTSSAAVLLYVGSGTLNLQVASVSIAGPLLFAANVPYFIAVSYNGVTANFSATNLATGALFTKTIASSHSFGAATNAQYNIGGTSGASVDLNGSVAAITYAVNNYLTLPQLEQWAAAPWDFWYPPTQRSLIVAMRSPIVSGTQARVMVLA